MPDQRSRLVTLCQQALVLGTVVAVAVPAMNVVSLDIVAPEPAVPSEAARSAAGSLVAAEPIDPEVTEVPVDGVEQAGLAALTSRPAAQRRAEENLAALSAPAPVEGYATVGITWDPDDEIDDASIELSVRTMTDGEWSDWEEAEYHNEHNPDPDTPEGRDTRPGTDALVVGDVDEVQVKAVTTTGTAPEDMSVAVVDPGASKDQRYEQPAIDTAQGEDGALAPMASTSVAATEDPLSAGSQTETEMGTTDPASDTETDAVLSALSATKPRIYSRAQWGANESLRDGRPSYGTINAGFVHHTVNGNSYTRDQVPSLLRGIYAYHTQSRGWSDIGYNFVVDKFGRIWEGRYGGVDRPVIGAHTYGYNQYSFAMSALGNFETASAPAAMVDAYARLMAWKLSLHGVNAADTSQRLGSKYFKAINGHRDAGSTACPGRYLYAQLPTIRSKAAGYQSKPIAGHAKQTNISGSRWPDLLVRDKTTKRLVVVRTDGQVNFGGSRVAARGWAGMDIITPTGDVTGDGLGDLVARYGPSKVVGVYPGRSGGTFGTRTNENTRLSRMDQITGALDMNSDGKNDLVVRKASTKRLYLFPGRGNGTFGARRLMSSSWGGYNLTAGVGDLSGDGRNDLVARDASGVLWLWRGNGRGGLSSRVAMPGSWKRYDVISGIGDYTNDGLPDIIARTGGSKNTLIFPGNGKGGLTHNYGPFKQLSHVNFLAGGGQIVGNKRQDLVVRTTDGRMWVVANNGGRNIGSIVQAGTLLSGTNRILNVGDWNRDGRNDVLTRSDSGVMWFRAGLGGNRLAGPVSMGSGWNSVGYVAAVGDVTGDGNPDLMGQPSGEQMRIYPGNGKSGFTASRAAGQTVTGNDHVGVSLFNGDAFPDSIVRRSDGSLELYTGAGGGALASGRVVGSGAGRYDWLQGLGDVDGDGHPDLVARAGGTGYLWLLPGNGSGGFLPRRFIGEGFGRFDTGT